MKCPKCEGKFKEFRHNGTDVIFDICQGCKAVWLDRNEFWETLDNKRIKKVFRENGLTGSKKTDHSCPRCRYGNNKLYSGVLPLTDVTVEHCQACKGFYFDKGEYKASKKQIEESSGKIQNLTNSSDIKEVQSSDFSASLFKRRLKELNDDAHKITKSLNKPDSFSSVGTFFSRIGSSISLIFKEPEILLFSILQALSIYAAYLLWVQMLDWIPPEVWKSTESSDDGSIADYVLIAWSFVCVGVAALPVGLFTACIGAVHILDSQGKESTIGRCLKLVFPKTWPIWIFSWVDGWITVNQILERLPKKNDNRSAAEKALSEAMYYAWKVGTIGVIPSLITTDNIWQACKNSLGLLKHKTLDILMLRAGYSIINWVVGILAYVGAIYTMMVIDIDRSEIHSKIYEIYFYMAFPIFIAVGFLHLFVRPFYILSLFDIYSDYMMETKQQIKAPERNRFAQTAIWMFSFLIILIVIVFLFRDELGITDMLSTPYGEEYNPDR